MPSIYTAAQKSPCLPFLANVRYMLSPVRLSVVCNVRAPYSGGSNFWQYFYGIRYLGHPLTSAEKFHGNLYYGAKIPLFAIFSERALYAVARPSVCRLSVVCNVRAPYSGRSNFRRYFYGIRYLGHPLISTENFAEIVPWEPLRRGS